MCPPAAVETVIDNVGLGLKGQWREAALKARRALALKTAPVNGLQRFRAQRVCWHALIHRPRLLLLDEPLGALDALTRLEMQDLIVSLWQDHGFTVLLVTHDVSEAVAMADRVLLIEEENRSRFARGYSRVRGAPARRSWPNWKRRY